MTVGLLLVTLLGTIWVVLASGVILLQRRSAAATIAWLLVLALLPILGLLLYRFLGPLRLERKRVRRRLGRGVVEDAVGALAAIRKASVEDLQVALVPVALHESPPLHAEALEIYTEGAACYTALGEAIEAARHHIHLEYYIWEPDRIGTRVRDQLVAKARAGVAVRMLVDGTGSSHLNRGFMRPLRDAGVEVAWFNPVKLQFIRTRRVDFRTHRKIVVCDGTVGFTGGMNIADAHSAELSKTYWRDTHLRIQGAAVLPMQRIFIEDWYFATGKLPPASADLFPAPTTTGARIAQIVSSGPDHDERAIHRTFFTAITRATSRIWLTTPYFVPDEALLAALCTAGLRGLDVRLIIPKKGDSRLVDLAARTYVPDLLAAKVRVFEYLPRFIHAKTFVVDDDLAIVGTANLDNRSFLLNFELAALLYDHDMNARLAAAYEADLTETREVLPADLAAKSLLRRLGEASARLMSPLL